MPGECGSYAGGRNERLLAAPILIPRQQPFFVPVVRRISHSVRALFCIIAMILTLVCLLTLAKPVFPGEILVYWMGGWEPRDGLAIGISLVADAWPPDRPGGGGDRADVVALLDRLYARAKAAAALIMSWSCYCSPGDGFCLSGDLFNQFVWLEVFSFAGFALRLLY